MFPGIFTYKHHFIHIFPGIFPFSGAFSHSFHHLKFINPHVFRHFPILFPYFPTFFQASSHIFLRTPLARRLHMSFFAWPKPVKRRSSRRFEGTSGRRGSMRSQLFLGEKATDVRCCKMYIPSGYD